jgi:hypothetical protein
MESTLSILDLEEAALLPAREVMKRVSINTAWVGVDSAAYAITVGSLFSSATANSLVAVNVLQ